MNTKSLAAHSAPWGVAAVAEEIRVRPRPSRRTPLARLAAAVNPKGLRALDLDFHPQRHPALGIGFLVAGALLALVALIDYSGAADQAGHWRSELARLEQAPRSAQAARRPADEAAAQQAEQAAAAVNQDIKRPWEGLFSAIEAARGDDIALLSLNPDPAHGSVRISGEARRREAILAYMEKLGQSRGLANVVLIEDQLQQQDPEKPFRFTLSADWRQSP